MTRAVRGLIAVALCVPLFAAGTPVARAAAIEASGWWWRAQTGLLVDVPPPASVPEGGTYVAAAADGPLAIAALRFRVPDDLAEPVLALQVAEARGAEAALQACPAGSPWVPGHASRWEDRPAPDCERAAVAGVASEDGAEWTFAIAPLLAAGRLDIVVVPVNETGTPAWPPFEVAFEPADGDAVRAGATGPAPSDPAEGPAPDSEVPDFTPELPSFEPEPPPDDGTSGFTPTPGSAFQPQPFGADTPAAEAADPGDVPDPLTARDEDSELEEVIGDEAAPPAPADVPPPTRDPRGLGLLLVVACAGAGMLFVGDRPDQRAVRGIGRFARARPGVAEAPRRGVGRFARERTGAPTPLL